MTGALVDWTEELSRSGAEPGTPRELERIVEHCLRNDSNWRKLQLEPVASGLLGVCITPALLISRSILV
jgi:hypothetical protein